MATAAGRVRGYVLAGADRELVDTGPHVPVHQDLDYVRAEAARVNEHGLRVVVLELREVDPSDG